MPDAATATQAQFNAARDDTPGNFHLANLQQARSAQQALPDLERISNALLGGKGPAFGAAHGALDALLDTLQDCAAAAGMGDTARTALSPADRVAARGTPPAGPSGSIRSRALATIVPTRRATIHAPPLCKL